MLTFANRNLVNKNETTQNRSSQNRRINTCKVLLKLLSFRNKLTKLKIHKFGGNKIEV